MKLSGDLHPARCGLVWAVATLAAVSGLAWLGPDLAAGRAALGDASAVPFERWLTSLCAAVAAGCLGWGWLVVTVVVAQALSGRRSQVAAGVPGWARRLVLAACGVAVLGATTPAQAVSSDDNGGWLADLLDGLPLPDRAEGPSVAETIGRELTRAARAPRPGPEHEVRPGDSLWSISERALARAGRSTDAATVAAYWHRVHEHNRERIGADPDLIHPGQRLRLPPLGKEDR